MEENNIIICSNCYEENVYGAKTCQKCGAKIYYNDENEIKDVTENEKTKYIFSKNLKKKIICTIIIIILVIPIVVFSSYFIKEQQRIEKYNNDLSTCYNLIKDKSDWNKFQSILKEHTKEKEFSSEAYKQLYQAIDERIENLKNGNIDEDLITMLEDIKEKEASNKEIVKKYLKANSYSNIIQCNKYIEEQKFKEAYDLLETIIKDNDGKNQDIVDIATNKQNEIKDKTFEQIVEQAQEKMNAQDYSSAKTLLEKYKDLGNQTILDMYNNATNEINRIEMEEKAKREAEEKARIEKEKLDFEIYCYFNMLAWKEIDTITDEIAYSKCAKKFGVTVERAKEAYRTVEPVSYSYQSKYPDIYEKYASQY